MTIAEVHLDVFDYIVTNIERGGVWAEHQDELFDWIRKEFKDSLVISDYFRSL